MGLPHVQLTHFALLLDAFESLLVSLHNFFTGESGIDFLVFCLVLACGIECGVVQGCVVLVGGVEVASAFGLDTTVQWIYQSFSVLWCRDHFVDYNLKPVGNEDCTLDGGSAGVLAGATITLLIQDSATATC